ncbi:MAG: hypothetical protein R3B81_04105 [bacterium]
MIRTIASIALAFSLLVARPAAGAFERPPVDAASAGVGGVLATSSDPVFGNPALASRVAAGVSASAARPFGLAELREGQVAAWMTLGSVHAHPIALAAGARTFGSSAWAERELRLGLAAEVGPGIAIGLAARGLSAGGPGLAAVRSVAVDLSLRVSASGAEIGAVAEAVAGEIPGDPTGERRRSSLGVRSPLARGDVFLELQRTEDRAPSLVLGVTQRLAPGLEARAGIREDTGEIAFGLGLTLLRSRVDLAVIPGDLGRTVRVSAGIFGDSRAASPP